MAETIPFPGARSTSVSDDQIPCPGSEDEYADYFSELHAETLRYVAAWGRWLQWNGAQWEFETTLAAFDLARLVARKFSKAGTIDPDVAKASVVASIERLARADRRQAATTDQWDVDDTAFNIQRREQ